MKEFILKTSLFLIVLFLINMQGNHLRPSGWENPEYYKKLRQFETDYRESTNTVFLGSSRTYRHVDVQYFDSLNETRHTQTTSYNLASSAIHLNELHHLFSYFLKDSLNFDRLDYLFLELDDEIFIADEYLYSTRLSYYITGKSIFNILRQILSSNKSPWVKLTQIYYHLSSMLRHHMFMGQGAERMKAMIYNNPGRLSHEIIRGYRPAYSASEEFRRSRELQKRRAAFLIDTHVVHRAFAQIDSIHTQGVPSNLYNPRVYEAYMHLIGMLETKGVHVICVLPMRRTISANLISLAHALPKAHVIDMSSQPEIHVLKSARYWFDPGHLNRHGARIYTELLSDAFQKIRHRNDH